MSIWYYDQFRSVETDPDTASRADCAFCRTALVRDGGDEEKLETYDFFNYGMSDNFSTTASAFLGICPACGWWKYVVTTRVGGRAPVSLETRVGSLRRLDLSDVSVPLDEVRAYLVARYESRFDLHPRTFENVVADVFRDHGFESHATAYSGDGGIDVVLRRGEGETIGIQVKRYRGRISVAQIRELIGALVIGGHTRGVFVTTSEFQAGAGATAAAGGAYGYPVELMDASGFLEALKIAQLTSARDLLERKPWGNVREWGP